MTCDLCKLSGTGGVENIPKYRACECVRAHYDCIQHEIQAVKNGNSSYFVLKIAGDDPRGHHPFNPDDPKSNYVTCTNNHKIRLVEESLFIYNLVNIFNVFLVAVGGFIAIGTT